jgi:hypothetical protein
MFIVGAFLCVEALCKCKEISERVIAFMMLLQEIL